MRHLPARWWLAALVLLSLGLLAACSKKAPESAANDPDTVTILAGSELKDLAPAIQSAAQQAGVRVQLSYAGTLDIVERVNSGEAFDAILPPNGAYPSLALAHKPMAHDKLFYSRVALGVKESKAKALGWDKKAPTWSEIAAAVKAGHFSYAMTNPTSSNTGMSALFAVASAMAKKTEDLKVADVNGEALKAFLKGQKLTAGSSGWLADAYVQEQDHLDGMINYEAVILRLDQQPTLHEKLALVYPRDGVISADYPLMLLNERKRVAYQKLVVALKGQDFQNQALAAAFLRPSNPDAKPAPALPQDAVVELSFPNSLDVIDQVLLSYQSSWRRPATSIFVLDTSGSMEGERINNLRAALKVLSGADASSATSRYARFQSRESAVLISFNTDVTQPQVYSFDPAAKSDAGQSDAATGVRSYADGLQAGGGTAIYSALISAYQVGREAMQQDPDRVVTIALLTDGENNDGADFAELQRVVNNGGPRIRVFPILFGEGRQEDMNQIADLTGGRVFNGQSGSLTTVFKEIRGYQ